jgi:hypothetical protein
MKDWEVRLHHLIGRKSHINNALNQALRLEAAKAVDKPQARSKGYGPHGNMVANVQMPQDWTTHMLAVQWHQSSERTANKDVTRPTKTREINESRHEEGVTAIITITFYFTLMILAMGSGWQYNRQGLDKEQAIPCAINTRASVTITRPDITAVLPKKKLSLLYILHVGNPPYPGVGASRSDSVAECTTNLGVHCKDQR